MISVEANDRLTRVGPDTPMGALLRRYWFPIATAASLDKTPVQPVTLLGEHLALFRDTSGRLGLVPERCPHRGASLAYGFPEERGLRCPYHGWLFSTDGQCLEQPNQFQDSPALREQCKVKGYEVQILGGLVFAYLGTLPAPPIPRYDLFNMKENASRFLDIGVGVVNCNWLQIMENSLDPTHVEWLHGKLYDHQLVQAGGTPSAVLGGQHVRIGFDAFEHGIIKRRLRKGQSEDAADWKSGHPLVFPNLLKVGGKHLSSFQIRVPMDDERTLHFWYCWYDLPDEHSDVITAVRKLQQQYAVELQRPDGTYRMDHIDGQDAMVWATQGARTTRQEEHLCAGDQGIVMLRRMLDEQMAISRAGGNPMNVMSEDRAQIDLPLEHKDIGIGGGKATNPLSDFLRTQGKFSTRLVEAVKLIDKKLGIRTEEREEMRIR